jgi:hypothetical protein
VANVDDFDKVILLKNAIENLESIISDDFHINPIDACLLGTARITPNEFDRCVNPGHDMAGTDRTAFAEVLVARRL